MNSIAATHFGTAGISLTKIQRDTAQMNCHVSSVIYKIRDHGPAILDGEFYKDNSNTVSPSKASAAVAAADPPAASTSVSSPFESLGVNRIMLFAIVLLSIALSSVAYYAYQQKMYVNELQADIKIYEDLNSNFE